MYSVSGCVSGVKAAGHHARKQDRGRGVRLRGR